MNLLNTSLNNMRKTLEHDLALRINQFEHDSGLTVSNELVLRRAAAKILQPPAEVIMINFTVSLQP